jgi:single-stranded-DNA-specific exonuclease
MKWVLPDKIPAPVRSELKEFSDLEAQLLFNKGITSSIEARKFFKPDLSGVSDPNLLPNAAAAAQAILAGSIAGEQIFIYGDYDVDGICSTAILFDFLFREFKAKVLPYVPSRFDEGYGLGRTGLDLILSKGGKLVITADCGIRDKDLVKEYTEKGLKFIITDHHTIPMAGTKLDYPKSAVAVVHPGLKKNYPFPQICATTVVWKLVQVLAAQAQKEGLLTHTFDTSKYLDLVALATVCDIMPLTGENRVLVSEGIKRMRLQQMNPGLAEIIHMSRIEPEDFDAWHFGFIVGPRLNAAGRIEHALDGVRLLTGRRNSDLVAIARRLEDLNYRRQQITAKMQELAALEAEEQVSAGKKLIFVCGKDWNEGVVGLVAGKLGEQYYLPVLVATIKDGVVKGSARSIAGFDITAAISQNKDLLLRFGGHNQAAGFTLKEENLEKFRTGLQKTAKKEITPEISLQKLHLEAILEHELLDLSLLNFIEQLKPFGYGNREPIFLLNKMQVIGPVSALGAGKRHLKFGVHGKDQRHFEVIGFNLAAKIATIKTNSYYDLAGTISVNNWNGSQRLQIKLKDLRPSKT